MATWTSPFRVDPHRPPDVDFEPGRLEFLVAGNTGRLLDYRRTPVRIAEVREHSGLIIFDILAFEGAGNTWEVRAPVVARAGGRVLSLGIDPSMTATARRRRSVALMDVTDADH